MNVRIKNGSVVSLESIKNELNFDFFNKWINDNHYLISDIVENVLKNKYSYVTVLTWARKCGFQPENKRNAALRSKQKYENTMIERYGETNPSKIQSIKDKKIQTYMERYGVSHPLKSKNFIDRRNNTCLIKYGESNVSKLNSIKKKKIDTFMEHYGVDNIFKSYDFIKNNNYTIGSISSSSQEFFDELSKYIRDDIEYYYYNKNHEFIIPCCEKNIKVDFCLINDDHKYVIEYNGSYWHCDPIVYDNQDCIFYFNNNLTCKEKRTSDLNRLNSIRENGFKVKEIWEHDILENKEMVIMDCLRFLSLEVC